MFRHRNDVLKQAEASLSSFIGTVNYSSTFSVTAAVDGRQYAANSSNARADTVPTATATASPASGNAGGEVPEAVVSMFDSTRMRTAVEHANEMTMNYGIRIISINIISARPTDDKLMSSLAKGAVAAAEAQQAETAAQGKASAMRIEAEGFASAQVTKARAEKEAADLLESSDLAVTLRKIEMTGVALGANSTFFFGQEPNADALGNMLANPGIVSKQKMSR
jgi:regulator of protease activity HflC (stomatin/prohibitin superfamily)